MRRARPITSNRSHIFSLERNETNVHDPPKQICRLVITTALCATHSTGRMERPSARMLSDPVPEWIANIAEEAAPKADGRFCVVVIEGDGRHVVTHFPVLDAALKYADDVASESEAPQPLAYVFAPGPRFVRRGQHYASV